MIVAIDDVFQNKKTGRFATVLFTGEFTGIYFIKFQDGKQETVGLSYILLNQRWDKQ